MSGRGGAGNIEAALQAANKVASQDAEPSQRDAEVGGAGLSIVDDASQGDRQYAHSGRGYGICSRTGYHSY
ncbi:hypothetical protein FH972_022867 [Carpinus fangiana]|uniref:Uncharacterized protein n=1 Tax=Carpinus fangiana TaxID=176857 RepID=A0A5N6KTT5_9ROSI|nr:hypothetical protein FH972_022867 [Carpinus fangiana]